MNFKSQIETVLSQTEKFCLMELDAYSLEEYLDSSLKTVSLYLKEKIDFKDRIVPFVHFSTPVGKSVL